MCLLNNLDAWPHDGTGTCSVQTRDIEEREPGPPPLTMELSHVREGTQLRMR